MSEDRTNPASHSERPRRLGFVQLALIVLAVAAALYFARAPDRMERGPISGAAQATPVVSVVKPMATEHVVTAMLTGTVKAERRARVRSEVEGRVIWVSPKFTEGGAVRANEPLVRIEPREFELEVEAAKTTVREAEAEIRIERYTAEENVASFERNNPGKAVPENVRRLARIARAEARLGRARAALALAELRLARTSISVPFDARVISSDVEVGELVGETASVGRAAKLGVVYRRGALQIRAPIDPEELSKLEPVVGRAARVLTRSGVYDAEVVGKSSVLSRKTRLTAVFLEFPETASPESLPAPGTFARIRIVGPKRRNVYVLPDSAARERDAVWVVRDGTLSAAAPKTVARTASGWVVEAFDAGDGVVVGALFGAKEGLTVQTASVPSSK